MNEKQRNIALTLGSYIGLLPLLTAIHSLHHPFDNDRGPERQGIFIGSDKEPDCQTCTYYFTQQLYLQGQGDHYFDDISFCFHVGIAERYCTVFAKQLHLRGPPGPVL